MARRRRLTDAEVKVQDFIQGAPTVREALIRLLQAAGYDTWSACEEASKTVEEVKARPAGRYVYGSKGVPFSVTIDRA